MLRENDQLTEGTYLRREMEGFPPQYPTQTPIPRHKDSQHLIYEFQAYQDQLDWWNNLMESGAHQVRRCFGPWVNCSLPAFLAGLSRFYFGLPTA